MIPHNTIGKSLPRVDAHGKVTGETLYSGDLTMPDMLHMKMLFADRPHARIKSIDISKAEVAPGVVAVYTAKDVPVNEYGLQWQDQPVLCGVGSSKPGTDVVRFIGDQVAAVVALTEVEAAAALKLIQVEYEDLPVVSDPIQAMKPDAPRVHEEIGDSNICVHYKIRKGNVEEGFAKADVIVEGEYRTPVQEHAYLQPEAGLAYIDEEGRITIACGGQWTHEDRHQVAHALGMANEDIRIVYPAIGGAFGGREDMSVQIVLALAAWKLERPVKIIWSRQESMIGHGKRHASVIRAKWGATKDGKVIAIENEIIGDGDAMGVGTPSPSPVTVIQCIEAARDKFEWENENGKLKGVNLPAHIKRGHGFAAGFKNVGFSFGYQENCWAKIEIHGNGEIERVVLHHASAEVGQGTHTVMAQMAAEAVGVPFDKVKLITSDSATMGNSGSVSASRMTFMSGNAIRGAAEVALKKWKAEERPAIGEYKYLAPRTTQFDPETGYSTPNFAYAFVAQAAEVEVDIETGHVRVLRFLSADDVGQAINPMLVEGQVEGAVVQAQGYALMEDFKTKDGHVLTDQLSTYLIPTIWDIPEKVETVLVEVPDPNGPWGARGLGELPFLTVAPVIGAAIHDATGVWVDEFPFTPERVLRALGKI